MENKFTIRNMNLYYGNFHALKDVNLDIHKNEIKYYPKSLQSLNQKYVPCT